MLHYPSHFSQEAIYYSHTKWAKDQSIGTMVGLLGSSTASEQTIPECLASEMSGADLSPGFLLHVFNKVIGPKMGEFAQRMASTSAGVFCSVDDTYAVLKGVATQQYGESPFRALAQACNEYNERLGYWAKSGSSVVELAPHLGAMQARCKGRIKVLYVDNPKQTHRAYKAAMPGLEFVRQDPFHWITRLTDMMDPNSPLFRAVCSWLCVRTSV